MDNIHSELLASEMVNLVHIMINYLHTNIFEPLLINFSTLHLIQPLF